MCPAPVTTDFWESFELPDGYRAEVIRHELVVTGTPALAHFRVRMNLLWLLDGLVPHDTEVIVGPEWKVDDCGVVAMAPQPDLMVTRRDVEPAKEPPLLAVEVLTPAHHGHLEEGITRIAGKRLDYAEHGLTDYLEIDPTAEIPMASRYELRGGRLIEVARSAGDEPLIVTRPFPYEVIPSALLRS
jgi:Uma2 family endonuclease